MSSRYASALEYDASDTLAANVRHTGDAFGAVNLCPDWIATADYASDEASKRRRHSDIWQQDPIKARKAQDLLNVLAAKGRRYVVHPHDGRSSVAEPLGEITAVPAFE